MSRTLDSVLRTVADNAIEMQREDGSLPAGRNGPHDDQETPVRNTSHYLFLFTRLFQHTQESTYKDAAEKASQYLLSSDARPHGYTFHHRDSPVKDSCNGIIGQAWTIEAIAEAGHVLEIPELLEVAEEVFLLHPFDEPLGLWKRVETDGGVLCFDSTFNHQLWFAAAGGLLSTHDTVDPEVERRVLHFLNKVESQIHVDESGLIGITTRPPYDMWPYVARTDRRARLLLILLAGRMPLKDSTLIRNAILDYTPISRIPSTSAKAHEKKVGYQSFHLYGFGILKERYPTHSLWAAPWLERAFETVTSDRFVRELQHSGYGYPYNVAGIELAYALDVFDRGSSEIQEEWLSRQFETCWDEASETFARNNPDPETLTARMYEATRLSDWSLEVSSERRRDVDAIGVDAVGGDAIGGGTVDGDAVDGDTVVR